MISSPPPPYFLRKLSALKDTLHNKNKCKSALYITRSIHLHDAHSVRDHRLQYRKSLVGNAFPTIVTGSHPLTMDDDDGGDDVSRHIVAQSPSGLDFTSTTLKCSIGGGGGFHVTALPRQKEGWLRCVPLTMWHKV